MWTLNVNGKRIKEMNFSSLLRTIPHDCGHFWQNNCRPLSYWWWHALCNRYAISCISNKHSPHEHYSWCICVPCNEVNDCHAPMTDTQHLQHRSPSPSLGMLVSSSFAILAASHPHINMTLQINLKETKTEKYKENVRFIFKCLKSKSKQGEMFKLD